MMLAESLLGERFQAVPGSSAFCPTCHSEVIAKCGEVKVWHWAHKSLKECDIWSEPESEWHYNWKKLAGLQNTEIVISNHFGEVHRADIKTSTGFVVELQHSNLSTKEVRDRENFYGKMVWVIDGSTIGDFSFQRWVSKKGKKYYTINKVKRAWINGTTKPVFFHFNLIATPITYHWEDTKYGWRLISEVSEMETFRDVLVMWSKKKFATIIPKLEFCQNMFGGDHNSD